MAALVPYDANIPQRRQSGGRPRPSICAPWPLRTRKHGESLVKAAAHEFRGEAEKAVLFLIRMTTEPLELLAELFDETTKGFGTDENALSSAVVRYHIVLHDIKPVYEKSMVRSCGIALPKEVSGDYGDLLLSVFDARD
ncbi:unnamed protein product [Peronospora belbahrii]|uniref:Uncharacterized protein n=1 Tax=Peronospora belbahrii TaxID=622444 RepID=A0ABN8D5B6_9STRA|nr:unnamed protein product [Peronospora belbahrii]